ncbi:hypothetical protein C8R34_1286 [Nitrosomonas sp. Nm84]|uniref:hypothetical protein n=1 Tax=Nitrosomonas sp. Nm84 TaxID=200124 RepID=UPI000D75ABF3|nr:hypothetical protein [Nitrosomonas sp. Nm84]PXW83444.1 hypothetical protein C8R34_1286 [Nitrosomonas sp. Nm84]
MHSKTLGINTRKSALENQPVPINDKHQYQNITAYCRTDKHDSKSNKRDAAEDWFEADEDSELEMCDIDASDFQLPEDDF